jgi:hypothetical protein
MAKKYITSIFEELLQYFFSFVYIDENVTSTTCVEAADKHRSALLDCHGGYISHISFESGTGRCWQQDGKISLYK